MKTTDAPCLLCARTNNKWRVKCRTKTKIYNVKIGSATQFLCKTLKMYSYIVSKSGERF